MAQLIIRTHDGDSFSLKRDDRDDESMRLPADGFITFRGDDKELTVHVKSIASILVTKGTA